MTNGPPSNPNQYNQYTREKLEMDASPLTPYGADANPNIADEYLQRLYLHGKVLLNRAMARVGGPIQDGPLVVRFGVNTPAGYQPATLDGLYASLFFHIGRCDSKYFVGREEMKEMQDAQDFGPFNGMRYNNNDEIDRCIVHQGQEWLDDFEEHVAEETRAVLQYVQRNPRVGIVRTPTYANMLRVHTPQEINAMLDTPLAVYRLGEALIAEARRLFNLGGPRFIPNLDGIFSTPTAFNRFGFPPGFAVPHVEEVFANLVYRVFLCRTGNAILTPRVSNWLGDGGLDNMESCIQRKVWDWYFDEFGDFGKDDVAPAVADFLRPELTVEDVVMEEYVEFAPAPVVASGPLFTPRVATVAAPLVAPVAYPIMGQTGLDLSNVQFTEMATITDTSLFPATSGLVLPATTTMLPMNMYPATGMYPTTAGIAGGMVPSVLPATGFVGDLDLLG